MNFRTLVYFGVPMGLLGVGASAQNCRPGSVDWDVNIQCSCDKDPSSDTCQLYKRNKSMYDGKGLQPAWNPVTPNSAPSVRKAVPPAVPQDRTPVSPTLLPAETPFWQALPAGTRIAIGVRPQWLSASPLFDQLLSLGGQAAGQKMSVDAVKRELKDVDTVIIATPRFGGSSSDPGACDGCSTSNQVRARSVPLRGPQHHCSWGPESNQCRDAEIVFTGPCER